MNRLIVLSIVVLALNPATARAVTLPHTLVFPTPTSVTDTLSGNQVNFSFEHSFPELETSGLSLTSGTLTLTHLGNLNSKPTAEAWSVFSGNGVLIGKLGGSNSVKTTDNWNLSEEVLNEMKTHQSWKLNVGLSEMTPFNSEKIDLYESNLAIDYDEINASATIPSTPEPSSLILLIGGLLTLIRHFSIRAAL